MTTTPLPLWGAETDKALANFPISFEPIPREVVRWLGRIKAAAAAVNADLGLLDPDIAARVERAAREVAAGEHLDQFPVDVFQTGSGTSSHMNANEVIARLAGDDVHPNDHVNVCQSSNCVFPSAVHMAAVDVASNELLPAFRRLAEAFETKALELADVVKAGRTHMMDAVPVTLGQEFDGYSAQVRKAIRRLEDVLERLAEIPLGGTATGSGLNVHPAFAGRMRSLLSAETGLPVNAPADPFEATGARDGLVEASGALRTAAVSLLKIANDLRLMASGPRTGLGEIVLPELQKGSSMMPGKVNPVIVEVVCQVACQVIGNDAAIVLAGTQGQLELNAYVPVMARNLLESMHLLARTAHVFADRCVAGIAADRERCAAFADRTAATATSLTPFVGYDEVDEIVREAVRSDRLVKDVALERGVDAALVARLLEPTIAARGGEAVT
jgi:fumarate hydratase, class II